MRREDDGEGLPLPLLNSQYSNRHGGMQRLFSKFRKASSFAGGASSSPGQGAEDVK